LLGGGVVLLRGGTLSFGPGASQDVAGTRRPTAPSFSEDRLGFSAGVSGSGGESSADPAFGSSLSPDAPEAEALGGAEGFEDCAAAACLGGGAGACLVAAVAGAGASVPGRGSGDGCGAEEAEVLCSRT
jgi:hypothetical protein